MTHDRHPPRKNFLYLPTGPPAPPVDTHASTPPGFFDYLYNHLHLRTSPPSPRPIDNQISSFGTPPRPDTVDTLSGSDPIDSPNGSVHDLVKSLDSLFDSIETPSGNDDTKPGPVHCPTGSAGSLLASITSPPGVSRRANDMPRGSTRPRASARPSRPTRARSAPVEAPPGGVDSPPGPSHREIGRPRGRPRCSTKARPPLVETPPGRVNSPPGPVDTPPGPIRRANGRPRGRPHGSTTARRKNYPYPPRNRPASPINFRPVDTPSAAILRPASTRPFKTGSECEPMGVDTGPITTMHVPSATTSSPVFTSSPCRPPDLQARLVASHQNFAPKNENIQRIAEEMHQVRIAVTERRVTDGTAGVLWQRLIFLWQRLIEAEKRRVEVEMSGANVAGGGAEYVNLVDADADTEGWSFLLALLLVSPSPSSSPFSSSSSSFSSSFYSRLTPTSTAAHCETRRAHPCRSPNNSGYQNCISATTSPPRPATHIRRRTCTTPYRTRLRAAVGEPYAGLPFFRRPCGSLDTRYCAGAPID
ncbi:hypothetical protein EDC01DRAFT_788404 [Geopyxis carbonaria]|nr:hypothetical protein EDC01DRAFT_788404 [Geopyxis carbonaria]